MDLKDNGTFLALATTGLVAAVGEFSTRSRQASGVVSVIDQVGEVFGSPSLLADKGRNRAAFGAAVGAAMAGSVGAPIGAAIGTPGGHKWRGAGGAFGGSVLAMMITNPIVMRRVQARVDARNIERASTATVQVTPGMTAREALMAPAPYQPAKPTMMDYYASIPAWVRVANAAAAGLGAWLSVPEDEGSYGAEWEGYGAQGW
jgi:hypothetical protein